MSWKNEIPPVRLRRAVPVFLPRTGRKGVVTLVLRGDLAPGGEGCGVSWNDECENAQEVFDSFALRVDLSDPQGMAYALQLVGPEVTPTILERFIRASCGDLDRATVALALQKARAVQRILALL